MLSVVVAYEFVRRYELVLEAPGCRQCAPGPATPAAVGSTGGDIVTAADVAPPPVRGRRAASPAGALGVVAARDRGRRWSIVTGAGAAHVLRHRAGGHHRGDAHLLAGLVGLWSERAGVVNIGIEGMMVLGTFGAAYAGYQWGPWAGVLFGIVCGLLGGLLHALVTVTFGVDHIISGVAITLLGLGVTLYLSPLVFTDHPAAASASPRRCADVGRISIPGLSDGLAAIEAKSWFFVSDVAGILRGFCTNLSLLWSWSRSLLVAAQRLAAVADQARAAAAVLRRGPYAAESLGVNVYWYKYIAVMISGGAGRPGRGLPGGRA